VCVAIARRWSRSRVARRTRNDISFHGALGTYFRKIIASHQCSVLCFLWRCLPRNVSVCLIKQFFGCIKDNYEGDCLFIYYRVVFFVLFSCKVKCLSKYLFDKYSSLTK
jgi:hypothetical protein